MIDLEPYEFQRKTIDMKETGWLLRKIREQHNLTVTSVAEHLSTTPQAIYNWEIGKTDIKVKHLIAICGLYDVSPADVLITKTEKAYVYKYDE